MLVEAAAHSARPTRFEPMRQFGDRPIADAGEGKDRAARTGHPAVAEHLSERRSGFRHLGALGNGRRLEIVSTVGPDVAERSLPTRQTALRKALNYSSFDAPSEVGTAEDRRGGEARRRLDDRQPCPGQADRRQALAD